MALERAITINNSTGGSPIGAFATINDGDTLLVAEGIQSTQTDITITPNSGQVKLVGNAPVINSGYSGADQDVTLWFVRGTGANVGIRWGQTGTQTMEITNDGTNWYSIATAGSSLIGYTEAAANYSTALGSGTAAAGAHANSVLVGFEAGAALTGADNVIIGYRAGKAMTTGINSVIIGSGAAALTAGSAEDNVIIGKGAFAANTGTSDQNIIIGSGAAANYSSSNGHNIVVGYQAGAGLDTESYCTIIGYQAGATVGGGNAIAIGYQAGYQIGSYSVAIGDQALYAATATNNDVVAIGRQAGRNSNGYGTVYIGQYAGRNANGGYNVGIGYTALEMSGASYAGFNVGIGYRTLAILSSGDRNVALGYQAMDVSTSASNSVAIGNSALGSNTTYSGNVAIGSNAMSGANGGTENVAVGAYAGASITTSYGVAVGSYAAYNRTSFLNGVALGRQAGSGGSGSDCVYIGERTGESVTGDNNVAIGYNSQRYARTGTSSNNISIGYESLRSNTTSAANDNIAFGYRALYSTVATGNIALGRMAGYSNTTDNYQVYIGWGAGLDSNFNCEGNVGVGYHALYNVRGIGSGGCGRNTAVGYQSLEALTINTTDTQAISNTAIGYQSGLNIGDAADYNTALGAEAIGSGALTANNNTAVGFQSLYNVTGGGNTAVGTASGDSITSGENNVCVGYNADVSASTDTNEIAIGYAVTGKGSNTTVLGNTSVTDTYVRGNLRVGNESTAAKYLYFQNSTGATQPGFRWSGSAVEWSNDGTSWYTFAAGGTSLTGYTQSASPYGTALGSGTASSGAALNMTLLGYQAGASLTTNGDDNTLLGFQAGSSITSGYQNVCVGSNTAVNATASLQVAVGYNARVTTSQPGSMQFGNGTNTYASRTAQFGDAFYQYILYANSYQSYSDVSLKQDIESLSSDEGLSLIQKLRPVSFRMKTGTTEYEKRKRFGLIAQEVKLAVEEAGVGARSVYFDEGEIWGLDYNQFVAPLIKSVQELSTMVKELQAEVALLKGT